MKIIQENVASILAEMEANAQKINENEANAFVNYILDAKHIFLLGTGRSGLALRAFANRLMHLGLSVSFIGEISSPHSKKGDIVILNSGSGETASLVSLAQKSKQEGLPILLNTTNKESTLYKLADAVIVLPGQKKGDSNGKTIQPMSSGFEQLSFVLFDAIVLSLMERLGETNETMYNRHCDLE